MRSTEGADAIHRLWVVRDENDFQPELVEMLIRCDEKAQRGREGESRVFVPSNMGTRCPSDLFTDLRLGHMLICMRTTLNLDDEVTRAVKRRAAETGRTMTEVIESALRDALMRSAGPAKRFKLALPTVAGGLRPGVDLADRDALYEVMEGRS